jgi:hypothetical protein
MSMSVGASSSNALSYLQQLLQQGKTKPSDASKATDPLSMLMQSLSGGHTSGSQTGAATSTASTASARPSVPPIGTDAMRMLIAVQGEETGNSAASKFFAKLDSDGDGAISQSEFSAAASDAGADSAVADAVFAKIDGNGDGSISQDELTKAGHGGHHHRVGGGGSPPPTDGGGSASAAGATTTTATNADGSTTTTIAYADGSKIDMTTPAAASSDGPGKSNFSKSASNMLEQLIKLQSQMLNAASSTLSAVA